MSEARRRDLHHWVKGNIPIVIAMLLSVVVLMVTSSLAHRQVYQSSPAGLENVEPVSRWEWFFRLSPNEMGDTLAGLLGALTLIWIIASVFHQSRELADQREVLREQKEEFKLMVAAQEAQVIALQAQAAVFEDERVSRQAEDARRELEEHLKKIEVLILDFSNWPLKWKYDFPEGKWSVFDRTGLITFIKREEHEGLRNPIRDFERMIRFLKVRHETASREGLLIERCKGKSLIELKRALTDALSITERLKTDQKIRLSVLRLSEMVGGIDNLLKMDIWDQSGQ